MEPSQEPRARGRRAVLIGLLACLLIAGLLVGASGHAALHGDAHASDCALCKAPAATADPGGALTLVLPARAPESPRPTREPCSTAHDETRAPRGPPHRV